MVVTLFEILDLFMIDTFLIKLIQFEKTGSIGNFFYFPKNLKIQFHFRNKKCFAV